MSGRSREEMEQALAESFGYPDYASFREGVAETLGKGVLRRLEKQLDRMTGQEDGAQADAASPQQAPEQAPPPPPSPS